MINNWDRYNESVTGGVLNDVEGILIDFKDAGFKIKTYELMDGGINIDISVIKSGFIKLNDNLIDSLLTLVDYLHIKGFKVRISVDSTRRKIEDFTNYDVYHTLSILCPSKKNELYYNQHFE